jgi:hypothetical protein
MKDCITATHTANNSVLFHEKGEPFQKYWVHMSIHDMGGGGGGGRNEEKAEHSVLQVAGR